MPIDQGKATKTPAQESAHSSGGVFRIHMSQALGIQLRACAEINGLEPGEMMVAMMQAALPIMFAPHLRNPEACGFMFYDEPWYNKVMTPENPDARETLWLFSRLLAVETGMCAEAHRVRKSTAAMMATLFEKKGVDGLRKALEAKNRSSSN